MKKKYITPNAAVIVIESESMICLSGGDKGRNFDFGEGRGTIDQEKAESNAHTLSWD